MLYSHEVGIHVALLQKAQEHEPPPIPEKGQMVVHSKANYKIFPALHLVLAGAPPTGRVACKPEHWNVKEGIIEEAFVRGTMGCSGMTHFSGLWR